MLKQHSILNGLKRWYRSWSQPVRTSKQPLRRRAVLSVEGLEAREMMTANPLPAFGDGPPVAASEPLPVLMVLANQDFYYQDYSEPRRALLEAGYAVEVAAGADEVCVPHWGSGQGADGGLVNPDLALADVDASRYSAVVFVGGWGASSYQYAFAGTYYNAAYNGTAEVRAGVNDLINDFVAQDKYVVALCTGVSVLAWARVDGASLLDGRSVAGYAGTMADWRDSSGGYHGGTLTSWHVAANGGSMFASGSIGDTSSHADDVWVDGKIITAEDYRSGYRLGQVLAGRLDEEVRAEDPAAPPVSEDPAAPPAAPVEEPAAVPPVVVEAPPASEEPAPVGEETVAAPRRVLMVIANRDFFYQEYGEPREELEAAGFVVEVAAATRTVSTPHTGTGEGADGGLVMPDWALADVDSSRYEAIIFVGGWGASQYQYAYSGTYDDASYNGSTELRETVNQLINEFDDQDKTIAAICHGVSVLAWARVDGASLLDGRTVAGFARGAPAGSFEGQYFTYFEQTNAWHIETNGGTVLPSGSVGHAWTTADDVWVDGNIITAENNESARRFGEVLVERLNA